MQKLVAFLICVLFVLSGSAFAKKKGVVKAVGGTVIPAYNLAIDASYDKKLNAFAPGYKILNVAIVNNSLNIIAMNPEKDRWWIKTKNSDKKYRLIGDLRSEDSAAWHNIPERARNLISYPLLLAIGAREVIDVFVPENVPVENFKELIVYIDSLGTTFEILARQ